MKFYIDSVECPETNGVGIDAVGGLFNCGLTGSNFKAICETPCSPYLSVVELKVWKLHALSLSGTAYQLDGA